MGGALALELAKRGRARSVVGISPAGGLRPGDEATAQQVIKVFTRMQMTTRKSLGLLPKVMARPGLRRLALRDVMTRGHQVPAAEAITLARSSVRCEIVEDVYTVLRNGEAPVRELDKIDVPVLITWGDKDRILPMKTHAPRLREEIRDLDFRVYAGRWPYADVGRPGPVLEVDRRLRGSRGDAEAGSRARPSVGRDARQPGRDPEHEEPAEEQHQQR